MALKTILDSSENSVLDSGEDTVVSHLDDLTIVGDTTFANDDILRIKDGVDDEWFKVNDISNAPTYEIYRDAGSAYTVDTNPSWKKGTSITNFKQSGDGGLYLSASESNAPYLSVVTHAGEPWTTLTTHLRLGNLNGFLGYSSDLFGIAIGTSSAYLKYDPTNGLRIAGHTLLGSLGISTGGYMSSGQTAYNTGTGFWLEYNAGTPRFSIGDGGTSNYLTWDGSTFTIRGTLNADDITAGTLSVDRLDVSQLDAISVNTGSLNVDETIEVGEDNVIIDGVNKVIKVYDASENLRVELGLLS